MLLVAVVVVVVVVDTAVVAAAAVVDGVSIVIYNCGYNRFHQISLFPPHMVVDCVSIVVACGLCESLAGDDPVNKKSAMNRTPPHFWVVLVDFFE